MAFPWLFEANFEAETDGSVEWDAAKTDTASQMDFPSYKELSRLPFRTAAPSSGAKCMRVQLTGGTADAFVLEGDINIAAAATAFFKFDIWFSDDFTGTADDTFAIFETQGTANAIQTSFGARIVALTNVINFGIGELAPTSFGALEITRGVWYTVELDVTIDDGGSNDGTIDLFVTRKGDKASSTVHASQVGTLDQIAVLHGVLGMQNHLATTTGTVLVDNFVMDDARIFPRAIPNKEEILMTKSGHAFVGAGEIENVSLLSGGSADNVLKIFDTDSADVNDASNVGVELKNTAASELVDPAGVPICVRRGAFIELSGTNPRAIVKVKNVDAFGTAAAVRRIGGRR